MTKFRLPILRALALASILVPVSRCKDSNSVVGPITPKPTPTLAVSVPSPTVTSAPSPTPTPAPPGPLTLEGKVGWSTGLIAGARVEIIQGPGAGRGATTDENGHYKFFSLDPGTITVHASSTCFIQNQVLTLRSSVVLDFIYPGNCD